MIINNMQLPKLYTEQVNKGSIDLTLSVNPLGCSARALKVLKKLTVNDLSNYPDTKDLVNFLAKNFRVAPGDVLLGNGSEQLIKLISQTFLSEGDLALVQVSSFALFTKEAKLTGAKTKFFDPANSRRGVNPKLIFLSNPSTPTGEVFSARTLVNLTEKFPKSIIVIDEANGEFNTESFLNNAVKSTNVLVLRTFSKVLGLAGLRVGVVFGPTRLIKNLAETQQPFPVSSVALKLAATALRDKAFVNKTKKFIAFERAKLTEELTNRGLTVSNSVTNNLFIGTPFAKRLIKELSKLGVSVIDGSFFPGLTDPGFRISIKDQKTNRLFLQKLDLAISCIKNKKLLRSKEVI